MAVTVGAAIERVAADLAAGSLVFGHGYDSAWDEAVALVLAVTGLADDRSVLEHPVDAAARARIEALAARRLGERIPLAYLLGHCQFAGYRFEVEPGVVVPRSPLGELVVQQFAPWLRRPPARILDLCCGTGCIGIVAALTFPDAQLDLVDVDPTALALARRNVERHGLAGRAAIHDSDLFAALPAGQWDLILTNPPYVNAVDMAALPPEYRHEPALGLAGGADGLDLVARMLGELPRRLAPGGLFVCEVGASAADLLRRFPDLPLIWPELADGGEGVFLLEGPPPL